MFEKAIETASKFTRPIHTISRTYNSTEIENGCSSLFFINADGWALTCKHVANILLQSSVINKNYQNFKTELTSLTRTQKKRTIIHSLEKKYSYTESNVIEIKNRFINCIEGILDVTPIDHPDVDLCLLKFSKYTKLLCTEFPIFPQNTSSLVQGKVLCRLGFPFAEFTNYTYDRENDKMEWTDSGQQSTPQFPLDGMVTRIISGNLNNNPASIVGFEMSTPGLKGQSGGPVFDKDGHVWGVQFATNNIYLGFDIKKEIKKDGKKKTVSDSAFLHVGLAIHIDVIKDFMRKNNVQFQEL